MTWLVRKSFLLLESQHTELKLAGQHVERTSFKSYLGSTLTVPAITDESIQTRILDAGTGLQEWKRIERGPLRLHRNTKLALENLPVLSMYTSFLQSLNEPQKAGNELPKAYRYPTNRAERLLRHKFSPLHFWRN